MAVDVQVISVTVVGMVGEQNLQPVQAQHGLFADEAETGLIIKTVVLLIMVAPNQDLVPGQVLNLGQHLVAPGHVTQVDDGVGVGHHLAPVIHDKAGKILRPAAQMDHVVMAKVRVGD